MACNKYWSWQLYGLLNSTRPSGSKACGSCTNPSGVAAIHGYAVGTTSSHSVFTDIPANPCFCFYCTYCSALAFSWLKPHRVAWFPLNLEYNMLHMVHPTCVLCCRLAMVQAMEAVILSRLSTFRILRGLFISLFTCSYYGPCKQISPPITYLFLSGYKWFFGHCQNS